MAYENGRLPQSALAPVPGGLMARDAAAAFNAMNERSEQRYGVTLCSEGPLGTYRPYAEQEWLWLFEERRGNAAAKPGTSNHGLGLAIDLATAQMRQIVDEIGAPFGYAKRWSDAPTEWWHLTYRAGIWHGRVPDAVEGGFAAAHGAGTQPAATAPGTHLVTRSEATAIVQQLLRAHGYRSVLVDGLAGTETVTALRRFQLVHGLGPTAGLDRETVTALRRAPADVPAGQAPAPARVAAGHAATPAHVAVGHAPAHVPVGHAPARGHVPVGHAPARGQMPVGHAVAAAHAPVGHAVATAHGGGGSADAPSHEHEHPHGQSQPRPREHPHPRPRSSRSTSGLSTQQHAAAVRVIVDGCSWLLQHKGGVHYTEGAQRWQAITQRLRIADGRYLSYGDCSSTVTWLLWNGLTHVDPGIPDIVNGERWTGGYTGTIATHGTLVRNDYAIKVGDLLLYGPPPTYEHVTLALGGGMCFSFGSEAGPFKLAIDYRPDRGPTRRFL